MNTHRLPKDELFQVERRIARRADELSRQFGMDPGHALENWRRAEEEVWRDRSNVTQSMVTLESDQHAGAA